MKTWNKWTKDEDELLLKNYLMNPEAIKPILQRHTWEAIKQRARKLGMKAQWTSNRLWTDEEIEFLKENYRYMPLKQLAKMLRRSVTAVMLKAEKLKIINPPQLEKIELKEHEWGYLAGIVDGEGCLTLKKSGRNRQNFSALLTISNTSLSLLKEINKMLGGLGNINQKRSYNKNCKPVYELRFSKREILLPLLEKLQHYLKLKKKQCQLLLEFLKIRVKSNPTKKAKVTYTQREIEIWKALKNINKRGRV